ncbi:hypothetical protein [Desulfobacter postgatei]|uniref:hypothetical protein n=1 Tax=Desulfobacter postgatei TaxID=2293 RepID=UPI00259B10C8|nr:hypothetical protein [uncultured Desulfobacter sp.]
MMDRGGLRRARIFMASLYPVDWLSGRAELVKGAREQVIPPWVNSFRDRKSGNLMLSYAQN